MPNRLYVDIKEDCHGNMTGPVKLPHDSLFTFEAILVVIETYATSVGKPQHEVLADMYNYLRTKGTT